MLPHYQVECDTTDTKAAVVFRSLDSSESTVALDLYLKMNELLEQGQREFVFDLRSLSYCDSRTLASWLLIHKMVAQRKGSILFRVTLDSAVYKCLMNARLDSILTLEIDN